jgi:hypothetical protein
VRGDQLPGGDPPKTWSHFVVTFNAVEYFKLPDALFDETFP